MQKVTEFLEKHVQWLALGLGLVWLLFMVWSYVINPPASVEVSGQKLTAGQVDEFTVERAAKPLEAEMKPKDPPVMVVDNFSDLWLKRMDWQGVQPVQTAGLIASPQPLLDEIFKQKGVIPLPGPGGVQPGPGAPPTVAQGIPALTVPPTPSDWRYGRSTAIQPPPAPLPGQPVQPVAAIPQEVDKDWVTQSFKLKLSDIDAAFKKAGIPANPPQQQPVFTTAFLKVEVVREELSPNGKWVNPTTLQPLNTGILRERWPAANAGIPIQQAYMNWAVAQTGDIVQPMFLQTVQNKGDMWERPGEPPAGAQNINWVPGQFKGNLNDLTPEQRKAELDARRAAAKLRDQQKQPARPRATPRGRGAPPEMEGEYAPVDPNRPKFLQVRQPYPRGYPGGLPPEMEMQEEMTPEMMEGQPPPQVLMGVGVPDIDYPAGLFDPAQWVSLGVPVAQPGQVAPVNPRKDEITIWAHDDTVQPGKTYRYKARYFIKNPLFQAVHAVKDPKAAREFAIVSPFSDWGMGIEVPPLTNFFIAAAFQGRIRFDVYTWKQGQNHHSRVEAAPGDVVGRPGPNGIDFSTGHVVVDVRDDLKSRSPMVYLANAQGNPVVRTQRGDSQNPVYKRLQELVKAAQAQPGQPAAAAR